MAHQPASATDLRRMATRCRDAAAGASSRVEAEQLRLLAHDLDEEAFEREKAIGLPAAERD